jgi:uncharacterized protein YdeI (YjbR/CyaY-like superfamily)
VIIILEKEKVGFFKSISLKVKLIVGFIFGLFSFVLLFFVNKKINAKKILELELEKLESEIKIKLTDENIKENKEEILSLEKKAEKIKEEISAIESGEKSELVSPEELDNFFDKRGF